MNNLSVKIVLLLTLFSAQFLNAQEINRDKLDKFFSAIEENNEGSGSVAIMKDDKLLYQNTYGFKNYEDSLRPTVNTQFRIGSITKTFTATLIMMAVEEGKLELNNKLSTYYPDFENSDSITITHLLQHRSGLYNFTNSPFFATYMTQEKTKEEMLTILQSGETQFQPGEKYEYSNTGYVLLSFILEDVYNQPFEELLNEKIIEPLNLERTAFEKTINIDDNEALSYIKTTEWIKAPVTNMSITMGAGAISSTAVETCKFFEYLFSGKLVSENSLAKMTAMTDNYGYGLFSMPYNNDFVIGHTGGIDGFQAVSCYNPDDGLSVTVLCNAVSFSRNDILLALLNAYYNKPYEIPDFKATVNVPEETLKAYVGLYTSESFPLDIEIKLVEGLLQAQATGQSAFPLTATDDSTFVFKPAGIKMIFDSPKNELKLEQAGRAFTLTKE
jgi:CubicO group peptidase (beta-lactamase class C family)